MNTGHRGITAARKAGRQDREADSAPDCPACSPSPIGSGGDATPTSHTNVPLVTQYATPGLIDAVAYGGLDPADDPAWAETGARDLADYARWCRHACGMACLRMALLHRDGHAPPLFELLRAGLPHGTYVAEQGTIRGLYYAPFVTYVREAHGLDGHVHHDLGADGIRREIARGRLVMASVHKEIRRPERPAPGRGGHLVLVTGFEAHTLTFHNPSGHRSDTRVATLPTSVFESFFARRGVTLDANAPFAPRH
ncbi:MAG: C39 family peptidase [Kineosporiaceae bacterium]